MKSKFNEIYKQIILERKNYNSITGQGSINVKNIGISNIDLSIGNVDVFFSGLFNYSGFYYDYGDNTGPQDEDFYVSIENIDKNSINIKKENKDIPFSSLSDNDQMELLNIIESLNNDSIKYDDKYGEVNQLLIADEIHTQQGIFK